jgi:hypothetical protein
MKPFQLEAAEAGAPVGYSLHGQVCPVSELSIFSTSGRRTVAFTCPNVHGVLLADKVTGEESNGSKLVMLPVFKTYAGEDVYIGDKVFGRDDDSDMHEVLEINFENWRDIKECAEKGLVLCLCQSKKYHVILFPGHAEPTVIHKNEPVPENTIFLCEVEI